MQVRLVVSRRQANHKVIVLKPETLIGRSAECNLRIASKEISRKHCRILITDDTVSVRDLGSANGTFVNGYRLDADTDYTVAPDSELTVGGVEFKVQFTPPSSAPANEDQTAAEPPKSSKKHKKPKTVAEIPDETVAEEPVVQVEEDWDSDSSEEEPTLAAVGPETDSDASIPIDDEFDDDAAELETSADVAESDADSDEFLADIDEPLTVAETAVEDDIDGTEEDDEFTQFADDEEEARLTQEDNTNADDEESEVTEDDITNFLTGMDSETEDSDESLGDFLKSID